MKEKQTKALDLVVIDPRTDKPGRACYDSAIITGINEVLYAGRDGKHIAQIVVAGLQAVNVDEDYDSLRQRWLDARGEEAIAAPEQARPAQPKLVRPS